MPKVSIILPVYNVEKYLRQCLDSLINQTLSDLEFICVDDVSTDNSVSILEEYAQKDARIKIIKMSENQGQGCARNKGLEYVSGKYIGFVDPDDWCELNMFEELYNLAEKYEAELIEFPAKFFLEKNGKIKLRNYTVKLQEETPFKWIDKKEDVFNVNSIYFAPWNKLYKADFILSNKILFGKGRLAEDQIFAVKARLLSNKTLYLNKFLYIYRQRIGSSSSSFNKSCLLVSELFQEIKGFLTQNNFYDSLAEQFEEYACRAFVGNFQRIPADYVREYEESIAKILSGKTFSHYQASKNKKLTLSEKIFSVKNTFQEGYKYKLLTIFFLTFRLKKYY